MAETNRHFGDNWESGEQNRGFMKGNIGKISGTSGVNLSLLVGDRQEW